jgi:transcriptional regulator with XRE-family HTH domain
VSTLRKIRRDFGWNVKEAARRAGIRPENLSRIETGNRKLSLQNLQRIASGWNLDDETVVALVRSGGVESTSEAGE